MVKRKISWKILGIVMIPVLGFISSNEMWGSIFIRIISCVSVGYIAYRILFNQEILITELVERHKKSNEEKLGMLEAIKNTTRLGEQLTPEKAEKIAGIADKLIDRIKNEKSQEEE